MEVINLNLIPTGALPVVHASQYDEGRTFRANLMDGSTVYTLDGTETLECDVKKPDGNIVTVAVTNTSDSYVEIDTTLQMCACAGESLAELHITKGAQEIGTLNFILAVERSPLEGGIESESEINNLATQVAGLVASEVEDQYDSANVIFDNEPTEGHGIPYTVTSEGIGNAIDNALDMTDTASGAIATFESEYALPLRNLEIEINAVQSGSGTPSPDNVRPITGFSSVNVSVSGVNLWDEETEIGGISWTTGANSAESDRLRSKNYIHVLPNTTYFMASPAVVRFVWFYDANKNIIEHVSGDNNYLQLQLSAHTFTTPDNAYYCRFIIWTTYGTTYNNDISINYPSTDTDYHAYNSTTTPITWQSEAGTVYGGSLDVTTGLLTVTHKGLSINSSSNFVSFSVGTANANATFNLTDATIETSGGASKKGAISSTGQENPLYWSADRKNETPDNGNMSFAINGVGTVVRFYITENFENISTIDDFKNAFTATTLVYPLATPVTYQLTPTEIKTILGVNNIWADTNGDTTLEYYTKRGEQTVRIAEGVAVDVINNKNIDNLTTTNKTLVGAVKEVDGRTKPTTVTPTFNSSQNNYSIPFNNTRVYKVGNVVYFTSTIRVDTPYVSSPGQAVYSGLPKPYSNDSIYMGFCAWNVTTNNMRAIVTSDGKLLCRGGNTGTAYDVAFSYVCQ